MPNNLHEPLSLTVFALGAGRPLLLFAIFAVPVGIRGVISGHLVAMKNTRPFLWAGPVRLSCIVIMLFLMPVVGIHGGMLGVAALFTGFLSETSTILVGMRCQSSSPDTKKRAAPAQLHGSKHEFQAISLRGGDSEPRSF